MLLVSVAGSQCNCVCILQSVYYGLYFARDNHFLFYTIILFVQHAPRPHDNDPINDLEKGNFAKTWLKSANAMSASFPVLHLHLSPVIV